LRRSGQADGQPDIARSSDADHEYIYFMGSETTPSLRCKLLTEIIILSARVFKYIYSEVV